MLKSSLAVLAISLAASQFALAATVIQVPLTAADLTALPRAFDPGGGFVFVTDAFVATVQIPSTVVAVDTYTLDIQFAPGLSFLYEPNVDRIDAVAALGRVDDPFGGAFVSTRNPAVVQLSVDNLAVSSLPHLTDVHQHRNRRGRGCGRASICVDR